MTRYCPSHKTLSSTELLFQFCPSVCLDLFWTCYKLQGDRVSPTLPAWTDYPWSEDDPAKVNALGFYVYISYRTISECNWCIYSVFWNDAWKEWHTSEEKLVRVVPSTLKALLSSFWKKTETVKWEGRRKIHTVMVLLKKEIEIYQINAVLLDFIFIKESWTSITVSTNILSSKSIFNIDNNEKYFMSTKSAYVTIHLCHEGINYIFRNKLHF